MTTSVNDNSFSGASLEKALKEGGLTQTPALLTGMVKSSEKSGHVSFSQSGCDMWVDLPTDMIESADHTGQRSCRDHSHPVMRITLKEPKDPEGRILLSLLAQAATNPSAEMPFGGSFRGPQFQGGMPPQVLSRMRRIDDIGQDCWFDCMGSCPMSSSFCHEYCELSCQVSIPRWGGGLMSKFGMGSW